VKNENEQLLAIIFLGILGAIGWLVVALGLNCG
jgi:hypothetical protein